MPAPTQQWVMSSNPEGRRHRNREDSEAPPRGQGQGLTKCTGPGHRLLTRRAELPDGKSLSPQTMLAPAVLPALPTPLLRPASYSHQAQSSGGNKVGGGQRLHQNCPSQGSGREPTAVRSCPGAFRKAGLSQEKQIRGRSGLPCLSFLSCLTAPPIVGHLRRGGAWKKGRSEEAGRDTSLMDKEAAQQMGAQRTDQGTEGETERQREGHTGGKAASQGKKAAGTRSRLQGPSQRKSERTPVAPPGRQEPRTCQTLGAGHL